MRIKDHRFSVPICIFAEPMPAKAFKLLVFLFGQSDFSGHSRPGYDSMRKAVRDDRMENGSQTTVRTHLLYLERKGWIFHMKKTNSKMAVWLQIPPRFRRPDKPNSLISVVQP